MGCCFLHAHHDDCVGDVRVDGDGADHSDDDDGCDYWVVIVLTIVMMMWRRSRSRRSPRERLAA